LVRFAVFTVCFRGDLLEVISLYFSLGLGGVELLSIGEVDLGEVSELLCEGGELLGVVLGSFEGG
jgi:hypothetical protein